MCVDLDVGVDAAEEERLYEASRGPYTGPEQQQGRWIMRKGGLCYGVAHFEQLLYFPAPTHLRHTAVFGDSRKTSNSKVTSCYSKRCSRPSWPTQWHPGVRPRPMFRWKPTVS